MPIGNLTAFLQYLMQILFAVLMAVDHVRPGPARGGLGRPDPGGPRARSRRSATPSIRSPMPSGAAAAWSSSATSSSATRAPRSRSCTTSPSTARPGQTTAIVGSTGSGKSTLDQPDPALLRRDRGARPDRRRGRPRDAPDRPLAIDRLRPPEGVPVQRHGRQQPPLRRRDGRPTRSSGTPSRSPRRSDFVAEMEGGLEAPIDQGGTNVSGGQRQRLAIARALVKQRRDLHLRRQLLGARLQDRRAAPGRAARTRLGDATVIIVAQRVGTIMHADRIVVLDDGRDRRHRHATTSCCETCETYREIVYSQLTAAEAQAA